MDTTRFTANRSYSIPVVVFTAGWFLLFIGLCVMQGRFNQLIGNVAHTPFSLFWFFIFFWLFTAAIFIGAIVMDEMARAKSLVSPFFPN